jgi:hypothetical protein
MVAAVKIAVGALVITACGTAVVSRSTGGESSTMHRPIGDGKRGVVAVSVELCALCSSPYDYQVTSAERALTDQCGGEFDLLEEGTQVSPANSVYVTPIGGGLVAGSMPAKNYYWVARCSE